MRLISILIVFAFIASLGLAQTAPAVSDPLGAAVTNAIPPVAPATAPQTPADPPRAAGANAVTPSPPAPSAQATPIATAGSAREKQQASIARQREAVKKQAEDVGAWLIPFREVDAPDPAKPALAPSPAGKAISKAACDPIGEESVAPIIDFASRAHSVHPKLLRAVIEQESRFHPCAVSPKGAKGLMQLMPDTAAELGVNDPFDPKENIDAGAKYLRQMLDKYKGDVGQALGAYNAGPAAVDQAGGIPNFRETRDYVQSIMQKVGTIPLDLPNIQMPKPIEN